MSDKDGFSSAAIARATTPTQRVKLWKALVDLGHWATARTAAEHHGLDVHTSSRTMTECERYHMVVAVPLIYGDQQATVWRPLPRECWERITRPATDAERIATIATVYEAACKLRLSPEEFATRVHAGLLEGKWFRRGSRQFPVQSRTR